ncbi:MAG: radical SAM protein [Candidatus Bipolaricaulota bacterium]
MGCGRGAAYARLPPAEMSRRAQELRALASPCRLCPRGCGARRDQEQRGFCGAGLRPWVASVGPHPGEERVLVGSGGSGTVFLTGCVLRCAFCQNSDISQGGAGEEVSSEQLARWMIALEKTGCHNANFVTPTHQAPQIVEALALAREEGLRLPVVWNCGGYESVEALRLLEGIVDIYMPDIKYGDSSAAERYSGAPGYWEIAQEAVREMHRQVGDLQVEGGIAVRGLLVRHLVLPGGLAGSENVLRFLAEEVSPDTFVNIMAQYYPTHRARDYPELSRRPSGAELRAVVEQARDLGLSRAGRH